VPLLRQRARWVVRPSGEHLLAAPGNRGGLSILAREEAVEHFSAASIIHA